ncbi:MAG: hypothetical protein UT33_C0006G0088 [Candidatus Peregrinibacteria bacterium GW2011_GWC2_39_14]|nr:MAG: hypothetical protein UT33_C0006G0088 [Candidatus Peregrinibacteria bacterium GW2011_GWC2_39_14]
MTSGSEKVRVEFVQKDAESGVEMHVDTLDSSLQLREFNELSLSVYLTREQLRMVQEEFASKGSLKSIEEARTLVDDVLKSK